jgi:hypothetical protein
MKLCRKNSKTWSISFHSKGHKRNSGSDQTSHNRQASSPAYTESFKGSQWTIGVSTGHLLLPRSYLTCQIFAALPAELILRPL